VTSGRPLTFIPTGQTMCTNCGEPLRGPFCARCGQRAAPPNPSIGDLAHELADELLHVDAMGGAIWRAFLVSGAYGLLLIVTMTSIVVPVVLRHR
jgi:hypothetical protein